MAKYKDYVKQMFEAHPAEFEAFSEAHANYVLNQQATQDEYNAVGKPIQAIIHEWEQRLCGRSERGAFGKYSANLAEKFHEEIKKTYPYVDFIGVKVSGPPIKINNATVKQPEPEISKSDKDIDEIDSMDLDSFDIPKLF